MPYIGKKPENIIATAIDTTTGKFSGAVTANAGVVVDNITIDGTEIDLSSGDLTVDVAGDIILDVDTRNVKLQDGGTDWGRFTRDTTTSPTAFVIDAPSNNVAIKFNGIDAGSAITALHLDMSNDGHATFKNGVTLTDGNLVVASGHGIDFSATANDGVSTPSELLDDYEEGTWTPTILDSSGNAGGTSSAEGNYTKVGRMVHLNGFIVTNSQGSASSSAAVEIGGIPFTISNHFTGTSIEGNGSVSFFNAFAQAISYIGISAIDDDKLALHGFTSSTETTIDAILWSNMGASNAGLRFSISYYAN